MTSPIPIVAMLTLTLVFQAIFFTSEAGERAFPTFEQPKFGEDECDGPIKAVICGAKVIFNLLASIWGVIVFVFDILTFNIPGSPWWVRIMITTFNATALVWSIARLIRGGG